MHFSFDFIHSCKLHCSATWTQDVFGMFQCSSIVIQDIHCNITFPYIAYSRKQYNHLSMFDPVNSEVHEKLDRPGNL